jgi:uncharacterized protein (TIGR04255 family)
MGNAMSAKLSKAPVFYVLAQVQFNTLMQLNKYVPEIQERLRKVGFPDVIEEQQTVFQIQHASPDALPLINNEIAPRWSFMNIKRTEGYILLRDALVYHTTEYLSSEDFVEKVRLGLNVVHEVVALDFVRSVGLRFLDAIHLHDNETLEFYLIPQVLGLADSGLDEKASLQHALSETVLNYPEGTLVSRVMRAHVTNTPPLMPAELVPLQLRLKGEFQNLNGNIAVLDTDHFSVNSEHKVFDLESVCSSLTAMKVNIQSVFEKMVTSDALEKWR